MSVISDALRHGHDIYVCAECVRAEGGTAPEGHIGTAHDGECRQCGKQSWLTPLTDWNWPGRAGRLMRLRREFSRNTEPPVRDAWLDRWLAKNPGLVLANDGDANARWLAEDGWMDDEPAVSRPPFAKRPRAVGWALVRRK